MTEDAEKILKELKDDIPDSLDKRDGSLIHTILAPIAMKIAKMEEERELSLEEAYVDTASLPAMILRARERGIEYRDETTAMICADITLTGGEITGGERFFTEDGGVYYTVVSLSDDGSDVLLVCENTGDVGNRESGNLIYDGRSLSVQSAVITGIVEYGRNAETVDSLRGRYYDSLNASSFGGNIQDYREKCLAVPGIGGVQVRRAWDGVGTVKLVLVSSDYTAISKESGLVETVQNLFDPIIDGEHTGTGIATIDHEVTAVSVGETPINIMVSVDLENDVSYSDVQNTVNSALSAYFTSLCETWAKTGKAVVRIGRIESVISSVNGVLEAYDATINGSSKGLIFDGDNIPILGTVEFT